MQLEFLSFQDPCQSTLVHVTSLTYSLVSLTFLSFWSGSSLFSLTLHRFQVFYHRSPWASDTFNPLGEPLPYNENLPRLGPVKYGFKLPSKKYPRGICGKPRNRYIKKNLIFLSTYFVCVCDILCAINVVLPVPKGWGTWYYVHCEWSKKQQELCWRVSSQHHLWSPLPKRFNLNLSIRTLWSILQDNFGLFKYVNVMKDKSKLLGNPSLDVRKLKRTLQLNADCYSWLKFWNWWKI